MSQICVEEKSKASPGWTGRADAPPERGRAYGGEKSRLSEDGTLCCLGCERCRGGLWHCGWPPSTCRQTKAFIFLSALWLGLEESANTEWLRRTSRMCIRSPIGNSRRGTWNAVWRHIPCGCSPSPRGWWPSNPAEEGWPTGTRPEEENMTSRLV